MDYLALHPGKPDGGGRTTGPNPKGQRGDSSLTLRVTIGEPPRWRVGLALGREPTADGVDLFGVELSNASANVILAESYGYGTILDDDPPPTISINDASIVEGNTGMNLLVFTVSLFS